MVLRRGKEHYREKILTENAFPNSDERALHAKAAWEQAIGEEPEAAKFGQYVSFTALCTLLCHLQPP